MFAQPLWLLLLAIPIGLAIGYAARQRVDTVQFSNPEFETDVWPAHRNWPWRVAVVLWLLAMVALPFAVAQPYVSSSSAQDRTTVMVVLDVSTSMTATDVAPSRLDAAQAAIAQAVSTAPAQLNIGLITLAGEAKLVAAPSRDRTALVAKVNDLSPQEGGTATGEGIFVAINGLNLVQDFGGTAETFNGSVILISDGKEEIQEGQRNLTAAAEAAASAGYTVSAVNYGTANGQIGGQPIRSDPVSLQAAATTTGGSFYAAGSSAELQAVLAEIQASTTNIATSQALPIVVAMAALALFVLMSAAFFFGCIVTRR